MNPSRTRKRILLGSAYSSIEPLGLLYLSGLARDLGWDPHIRFVKNHDFSTMDEAVRELKPDIVGYTLYTGNHEPLYAYFDRLKKEHPGIATVIGGPHATYFPVKSIQHADYAVVSEGFDALTRILNGEAKPGILYPRRLLPFPRPERRPFYRDYPDHRRNPIKNVISMTGCPFACTYCYNSSNIKDTMGDRMCEQDVEGLRAVLGRSGRLFPMNARTAQSVLQEIRDVLEVAPETKMFYWQDDTLGIARHIEFLREFKEIYDLGLPFHGQTRFEMLNPENERGREVMDLLKAIGFNGMTMAIEAADATIRKEVLNRVMPDELMFNVLKRLGQLGFRLRTEQITGLPYGATSQPTAMNLEADLGLLKLNMDLRRRTGLPNISWATTLIPYMGTKMSSYCIDYGFVTEEAAQNPEDGYHERSVLRHLKSWVGPSLAERKDDPSVWMDGPDQERYRDQNTQLRYHLHVLAYLSGLPDAEQFAARHLETCKEFSVAALNEDMREYIRGHESEEGRRLWGRISEFERGIPGMAPSGEDRARLRRISAYCAVLPGNSRDVASRYLRYAHGGNEVASFSNVIKKYLFDTQLYMTEECTCELYDGNVTSGCASGPTL